MPWQLMGRGIFFFSPFLKYLPILLCRFSCVLYPSSEQKFGVWGSSQMLVDKIGNLDGQYRRLPFVSPGNRSVRSFKPLPQKKRHKLRSIIQNICVSDRVLGEKKKKKGKGDK